MKAVTSVDQSERLPRHSQIDLDFRTDGIHVREVPKFPDNLAGDHHTVVAAGLKFQASTDKDSGVDELSHSLPPGSEKTIILPSIL
jgi:hypothetical protein